MKSLDLFCGAGGLSLGFKHAGIECTGAIEVDRFACETYAHNFPEVNLLQRDVRSLSDSQIRSQFRGIEILAGGPPCQGFSVAGPTQYGKVDSTRNSLVMEMVRFTSLLKPEACVIENVRGILSGRIDNHTRALEKVTKDLSRMGYSSTHFVLQAADFGVPQNRERVFIFAVRDKRALPEFKRSFGTKQRPWRTVWEAVGDLPEVENGQGHEGLVGYTKSANCSYQRPVHNRRC